MNDEIEDPELLALLKSTADTTFDAPPPGTWDRIAAQLDAETQLPAPKPKGRAISRRALLWGAGGVIAGGAVTFVGQRLLDAGRVIAEIPLRTLDTHVVEGRARIRDYGGRLLLEVDLPDVVNPPDGYIEVWLLNRNLTDLVSVGIFSGQPTESYPVSRDLLDRGYVIVDLSQERYDGNSGHSGDSLVRGQLPL